MFGKGFGEFVFGILDRGGGVEFEAVDADGDLGAGGRGRGVGGGGGALAAALEVEEFTQVAVERFFEGALVGGDAVDVLGAEELGGDGGAVDLGVGGGVVGDLGGGFAEQGGAGDDGLDFVVAGVGGAVGDEVGFGDEDAAESPIEDDEAFDQEFFGDADGGEVGVELGGEAFEFLGVLGVGAVGDEDAGGVEAVFEGVEAGEGAALGGEGGVLGHGYLLWVGWRVRGCC